MFKQASVLAATGVAWLAGCGGVEPQMEQEEIVANLIEAGYPARDIQVIDEAVYVGGDAHVTLQASRCLQYYGHNEGDMGVGAIPIPGTPETAVWDGSVMNMCPHVNSTGEFTDSDATALFALYGKPCESVNVAEYRGQTGKQLHCACSSGGAGSVWGTNNYTDDSNICRAAVHAGVMTPSGGKVTVEVQPAQSTFIGTTRNGVTTSSYGYWGGSYRFIGAQIPQPQTQPLCSTFNMTSYRGQSGRAIRCGCPTVSLGASIWGTDLYTDDSDVCAAAVHAGAIPASGGDVTVTIQPGQSSYTSTSRYGVTSSSYGSWAGSISLSP